VAGEQEADNYLDAVRAVIDQHKRYPAQARLRGQEGRVIIRFRVDQHGRVVETDILQSSGSRLLDAATVRMLRALHLPEPPPDLVMAAIDQPVDYILQRQ